MKIETQVKVKSHFQHIQPAIFWPSDLSKIFNQHRASWDAWDTNIREVTDFLVKAGLLKKAKFMSRHYPPIVRYLHGVQSPHRLALSLRRDSFLSHRTALGLHGLASPTSMIYVNKEQSSKPEPEGLTQPAINLAFTHRQRQSNYQFQYGEHQYLLINGKNTGRAGVIRVRAPEGDHVDSTDLERTLIDVAVRPAYAGGLDQVAAVYQAVASRVDLEHLIQMLRQVNYIYPYAQSIGFLLERAGRPEKDLIKLQGLRSKFDFFLDYGLKHPAYDEKWKLFFPSSWTLVNSAAVRP